MGLRFLPLLWLFFMVQASLAQQQAINVPFDYTTTPGIPLEVTGKISVQETITANQVKSSWEKNVIAKNITNKPILLLRREQMEFL